MLDAWRLWLVTTERLIVVGYSFSDLHINETIRSWLATDPRVTLTIVDPYLDWAAPKIKNPFLLLLRESCGTRVDVVRLGCGEALVHILGAGRIWPTPEVDRWGLSITTER